MQPNEKRRSLDGLRPEQAARPVRAARKPEYRYDHELPAPEKVNLLREATPVDHANEPVAPSHEVPIPTEPLSVEPPTHAVQEPRRRWLRWVVGSVIFLLVVAVLALVAGFSWYQSQLAPVSTDTSERVRITIESGATPDAIADYLQLKGVIRSSTAFRIYTKLSGTQNVLKAGSYSLQPSLSTEKVVEQLVAGKQDTYRIEFLPGGTLQDARKALQAAGFGETEIDAAFERQYDRPLFAGKPASADLEGYIFGEQYEFHLDVTVDTILERTFDEFEAYIKENDLVAAYKKRGLSLYEGITLASIVQKEVAGPSDSKQVAQVFYKRLADGMPLGADATFVYAAKKAGKQPTVDFDSLYNTRVHAGLPPGPISVPGVNALKAVAEPASGDYLYFVSGDDGKNHFSRTLAEHEAKTRQYCIKNCSLF